MDCISYGHSLVCCVFHPCYLWPFCIRMNELNKPLIVICDKPCDKLCDKLCDKPCDTLCLKEKYISACVLPMSQQYSKYLFHSSFAMFFSSLFLLYFHDYTNSFVMFILFLTSIQFWYRPDYGIRRNIDMFLCKFVSFYYYWIVLYGRAEIYSTIYLFAFIHIVSLYVGEMIMVSMYNPQWIVLHMAMHFEMAFMVPFILHVL